VSGGKGVLLVGDGIENPANALTMVHAAAMFGAACRFRDTKGLAPAAAERDPAGEPLRPITGAEVRALASRVIAFDNLPGARDVYGFHGGRDFVLLVGNERRGLSREFAALAGDRVQVPMLSRRVNCLNVAAAAAVGLYYLCAPPVGPMAVRRDPRGRRQELLLFQPGDHFEAGSTIRSAAAFGWERAFIEDRHQVWFDCGRAIRSEGRAAARRGRNDILLIPCPGRVAHAYPRVTVITRRRVGAPLHRVHLTGGPSQLVVIPDESMLDAESEDWSRLGATVEFARLQLPVDDFPYHYRLAATVALAEISRQVGHRQGVRLPAAPRRPIYDLELAALAGAAGEIVRFEDLASY
jgi:tRNA(Leu) C34 or U34 (ribose-2'-O)-methylase TrmL